MEYSSIDHIVYGVPNLEKSIEELETLLGVRAQIGGRHVTKGTKNALINFGDGCYFEILAIDHENLDFEGKRWMGIDYVTEPRIIRWSLKSNRLEQDCAALESISITPGKIEEGRRVTANGKELSWRMTLPGSAPDVEVWPFLTDWSSSELHPTDSLDDICKLEKITLSHPDDLKLTKAMKTLGANVEVQKGTEPIIEIVIRSPRGRVALR